MGSIGKMKREFPPKHFSLRIESFSKLAKACTDVNEKYQSVVFSAQGHSWKLYLYPNGNSKQSVDDHISLYLAIANLPFDHSVHVEFKFFVFDKINDNYLVIQDGRTNHFHGAKTEWGYDKLVSLDDFKDPKNGYLVRDSCEFGVEISVVGSKTEKRQTLTMVQPNPNIRPINFKTTFKGFSKMVDKEFYFADPPITFGEQTWKIKLFPKGHGNSIEKGNFLSLYLELVDAAKLQPGKQVWAEYKLKVLDQHRDNHVEKTVHHWFGSGSSNSIPWGSHQFMPLGDVHEERKGYVVNDKLIVEVDFINVSVTKITTASA